MESKGIMSKIVSYKITGSTIFFQSDSGSCYEMTKNSCTCKGFSFHRTCSHLKEAEAIGLFKLIDESLAKQYHSIRNNFTISARKQALYTWLAKNGLKVSQALIDKIEPKIKSNTNPNKLLQVVRSLV